MKRIKLYIRANNIEYLDASSKNLGLNRSQTMNLLIDLSRLMVGSDGLNTISISALGFVVILNSLLKLQ